VFHYLELDNVQTDSFKSDKEDDWKHLSALSLRQEKNWCHIVSTSKLSFVYCTIS